MTRLPIHLLGQSGCRIDFPGCPLYIDPYLSNAVEELDAPDLKRLIPIPVQPASIDDAAWVLLTHEHLDHCDPHTLPKLAQASPDAKFCAPAPVVEQLLSWEIDQARIHVAEERWQDIAPNLCLRAVPAAHPDIERDANGRLSCVGYVLDYQDKHIYLAGDTAVCQTLIDTLKTIGPIHTAFLPVNEDNFFRRRRGIIGNMSIRDAYGLAQEIGVRQVIPVHWDMFAANEVTIDEIHAVYQRLQPDFDLLLRPQFLNLADVRISIIIRTLNEARYLDQLLHRLAEQETAALGHEIILVDSGSTDDTLLIAERHGCRILNISREEFSFGRSLNLGCQSAKGDFLVMISGHCIPTDTHWLQRLCEPLIAGDATYTYGRQLGGIESHYSEKRIFDKYFPADKDNGQKEFYCNNANSALCQAQWQVHRFDEELTGLEDMELAQRMVQAGGRVAYVPEAAVYHYHQETWAQIQRRFEREAIALQRIMPQLHIGPLDLLRYISSSVYKDWRTAWDAGCWREHALGILRYRWHQYFGVYQGNNQHRRLSHVEKEKYFYPV